MMLFLGEWTSLFPQGKRDLHFSAPEMSFSWKASNVGSNYRGAKWTGDSICCEKKVTENIFPFEHKLFLWVLKIKIFLKVCGKYTLD